MSTDDHDLELGSAEADDLQDVHPRGPRHVEIEQRGIVVDVAVADHLDRFETGGGGADAVAFAAKFFGSGYVQLTWRANYKRAGDKLGVKNSVSYGFVRDAGGVPAAVKAAKRTRAQRPWAMKSDITAFFDRIDRAHLTAQLKKKLGQCSVLPLDMRLSPHD